MADLRHKVFTQINKLFITSASLFFVVRYISQKILIRYISQGTSEMVALSIGLLVSYLPYFIKNNFGSQDKSDWEKRKLTTSQFVSFVLIILFFNVVSYFFISGIDNSFNTLGYTIFKVGPRVTDIYDTLSLFIYSLILAPIFEELIYRDFILKRLRRYGEVFAIVISSLLFGLIHGNISQFISSFLLGIVLGYVYIITNSVKTTIFLHLVNNAYVTIYNELLFRNVKEIGFYQVILIVELVISVFLLIYALWNLRKDSNMHLKTNLKSPNTNSNYRLYFYRITTILVFISFAVIMILSINKIGV